MREFESPWTLSQGRPPGRGVGFQNRRSGFESYRPCLQRLIGPCPERLGTRLIRGRTLVRFQPVLFDAPVAQRQRRLSYQEARRRSGSCREYSLRGGLERIQHGLISRSTPVRFRPPQLQHQPEARTRALPTFSGVPKATCEPMRTARRSRSASTPVRCRRFRTG